jgi:glycine/D-amino acid oxidase-like deaminating enzyme
MKGLAALRKTLGDKAISFEQKGGYELFITENESKTEQAFSAIPYLNKLLKPLSNNTDIFAERNDEVADFGFSNVKGLIYNSFEGQIDTGKMMQALLTKAQVLGIKIFNNCNVLSYQQEGTKVSVVTNEGSFKTRKLLFATNGFTKKLLPTIDIKPARGQVLVTEPIPNLKINGTYHYDEGFYYFRDIDNRILFGGGRNLDFQGEETDELITTSFIQEKLEQLLFEVILPKQKAKIDYRWSGIMGFGDELAPITQKIEEGIYLAARCNGMGVAIGTLTGQEIAEIILLDIN